MIRDVESCPYCNAMIAIDDGTGAIVFNPDRADPEPCSHLTCFLVILEVIGRSANGQTTEWHWEYGKGLRAGRAPMPIEDTDCAVYLMDYPRHPSHLIPKGAHVLVGNTAMGREETRPGSGEFLVVRGKESLTGILDAWAMFSPRPGQVVVEFQRLRKLCPH